MWQSDRSDFSMKYDFWQIQDDSLSEEEPGHALGNVAPDVLLFRLCYGVDRWRSPVGQYGVDRPPTWIGGLA